MSELPPPYIRDPDLSPPPPPEAVEGQAGRPAVSPPLEPALPLSGGGVPPPVTFPPARETQAAPGAGGEPAPTAPAPALPPSGVPVGPVTQADYDRIAPRPAAPTQQGPATLTPPTDQALPAPAPGPGGAAVTTSPEPAKTAAAPVKQQPAQEQPLTATSGSAAVQTGPPPSSAQYKGAVPQNSYNYLANTNAELFNTLADEAARVGVSPSRLIHHAAVESDFRYKTGRDGEQSIFQILPATQVQLEDKYFNKQRFDLSKPENVKVAARMAALYIKEQDDRFGVDSYASVAAYNGGPGFETSKGRENALRYAAKFFDPAGKNEDYSKFDFGSGVGGTATANGYIQAVKTGGPDGGMRYMVNTVPRGLSMSDGWQHVQSLMISHFILNGDIDGAQKAQDFVIQQAFMGSNMHLMGAQASLARGDGVMAAQQLAKAHAFFPDGTAGRFMTNGRDVFGVRLDEATGKPLGSPFKITAQDIDSQLKFTGNPATFAKFLSEQQKTAADLRYKHAQAGYQEARPAIEAAKDAGRNARTAATLAQTERTQQYIDRRQAETNLAADRRAAAEKDPQTAAQIDNWMKDDQLSAGAWPLPEKVADPAKHVADRTALARSLKANAPGTAFTHDQAKDVISKYFSGAYTLAQTPGGFTMATRDPATNKLTPVPGNLNVDISTGEYLSGKFHHSRRPQEQQQSQQPQPQQQGARTGSAPEQRLALQTQSGAFPTQARPNVPPPRFTYNVPKLDPNDPASYGPGSPLGGASAGRSRG